MKSLASALLQNRSLTRLDLGTDFAMVALLVYNNLGDEGAKAIAGSLPRNRGLATLNIGIRDV